MSIPKELRTILSDAIITHLPDDPDRAATLIDLIASLSVMSDRQLAMSRLGFAEETLLLAFGWRRNPPSERVWTRPLAPNAKEAFRCTLRHKFYYQLAAIRLTQAVTVGDPKFYEPVGDLTGVEYARIVEAERIAQTIGASVATVLRNAGNHELVARALQAGLRIDGSVVENRRAYFIDDIVKTRESTMWGFE